MRRAALYETFPADIVCRKDESLLTANSAKSGPFRFGSFEFDPRTGELRKQGIRIRVEGQPQAILAILLERPGELVTREELQKRLWPSDTFVDFEQSLNAAIRRLRLALDDSAESPRYVETLARKGYRWVAPVAGAPAGGSADNATGPEPKIQPQWGRRAAWLALAATTVAAAIFAASSLWRPRSDTGKVMLAVLPFQNLSDDTQQEYFADGMTEEMITQLGGLDPQHLGVIAADIGHAVQGQPQRRIAGCSRAQRELSAGRQRAAAGPAHSRDCTVDPGERPDTRLGRQL